MLSGRVWFNLAVLLVKALRLSKALQIALAWQRPSGVLAGSRAVRVRGVCAHRIRYSLRPRGSRRLLGAALVSIRDGAHEVVYDVEIVVDDVATAQDVLTIHERAALALCLDLLTMRLVLLLLVEFAPTSR
mmetsp:Transcript_2849/g.3883  ORF Transcript_2849/g.3883 Transcript_2849/m.3883 type:complete len:131 (+) Transcript_2849:1960-2352(+)|eukprot:CAMPEP_0185598796 /NCGR_PEP_ID=MMETSP0434-20130131/82246_1 /TAXON_ID=626734 ORGANISM="Favella taraikaensis, Strain Fe Narragansett Bay" /NCGR_SAMPLE_ID=MMETSP0434 /ASSEMBLY_ACC=CAM_ASM_000379 /LENGTH=130 /DNA_ID=CAMNT_0028227921 /DNA_START=1920 /DNA_END=2312 /DNA_ORIENTATION=+